MHRSIAGWVTHRWAKWVVLVLSLLMIGAMASMAGKLGDVQKNDISSWLPGQAESTKVINASKPFTNTDAIPAVVLYTRDGGVTPADLAAIKSDAAAIGKVKHVDSKIIGPIPSKDGKAVELIATVNVGSDGWNMLPDVVDNLKKAAKADSGGLKIHFAGPAALGADQAKAFGGIDGILLFSALIIVFLILLITYRSLQLAVLFLLCGVGAVGTAEGVVYLLAKHAGLTVNGQSAGILSVLVLGAGVDYALLLVARYREELHNYEDRHEAMRHALHRAAPAVLASGLTVIIGLLCLMFAQMNSTSSLGPVGAAGIACALLVMMILLPALLVIFGRWIFWPFVPRFGDPVKSETGVWARTGHRIAKAPRMVWVVTTLVLVGLSLGITQLNAHGLSNEDSFTTSQPSIDAGKLVAKHFPAGDGSPVSVVAKSAKADEVKAAFAQVKGIDGSTVQQLGGDKNGTAYFEGTLTSAADSTKAFDTIDRARTDLHKISGADALVGGNTAVNKDVQSASGADNKLIIPIILLVVLLVLMLLLRAIAAPVILLVTVVVSFGAAMGISGLVFHNVFNFGGTDTSFPLFAFVFLVALGIDYNIFLMTRVREESLVHGTRKGALIGLGATGGVITSAGFVLAGTFAALATLPIVFLAELGFAVAVGVLLDTIIVRSVLVTAVNLDVGRHIWWPSQLSHKLDDPTTGAGDEPAKVPVNA
jgi:RND superfamily putative drug exporter